MCAFAVLRRRLGAVVAGFSFIAVLAAGAIAADDAKDFSLTVDGIELGINAGDTLIAKSKTGADVEIRLTRRPFAYFKGTRVNFDYPSGLSVAATAINKDIRQYLLATATGSLIIIQEYSTLDPAPLLQLMLNQVAKDDVAAGGKLSSETATRKLADGTELSGIKARVIKKSDAVNLEILALGKANQGVLIMTRIDSDNTVADQPVIDRLWSSLKVLPVAE